MSKCQLTAAIKFQDSTKEQRQTYRSVIWQFKPELTILRLMSIADRNHCTLKTLIKQTGELNNKQIKAYYN
jgi:hypothetical protein